MGPAGGPAMRPLNLTVTNIHPVHYREAIQELEQGLAQQESIQAQEPQRGCWICYDTDHTAEQCWYHNPLLLAYLGHYALLGEFWRCFHCGAVFMEEAAAQEHFGRTPDSPAACL